MAKYEATYSCGHAETINLIGPHKQRERKLEWYTRRGLCGVCHQALRAAQREERSALAAENAYVLGLPDLHGSEKQIAWALTIRDDVAKRLQERLESGTDEQQETEDYRLSCAFADWLYGQNEARWWIDHRGIGLNDLYLFWLKRNHPEQVPASLRETKTDAEKVAAEAQKKIEAAERQKQLWKKQDGFARRVLELFSRPVRVQVWNRDGEKRVYVGSFGSNALEYYHTGNRKQRPGSLYAAKAIRDYAASHGSLEPEAEARFRSWCEDLCAAWASLVIETDKYPKDGAATHA